MPDVYVMLDPPTKSVYVTGMDLETYHHTGGHLLGTIEARAMPYVGDTVPVKVWNGLIRGYQKFGLRPGAIAVGLLEPST